MYEENVFPIIELELTLTRELYKKIQKYSNVIYFALDIRRYQVKETDEDSSVENMYDYFIQNEVLKPFDIDRNPIFEKSNIDKEYDQKENTTNHIMRFSCFMKKHLDFNKELINNIVIENNIKNTMLYVLNSNKANNILMDEPDNTKKYNQIILPGYNLTRSMEYLQEVYGIYENGIILYFDIKNGYILKKNNIIKKVQAKDDNFFKKTNIHLLEPTKNSSKYGMYFNEETNTYIIRSLNTATFSFSDTSVRELGGEYIKFISSSHDNKYINRIHNLAKISFGSDKEIREEIINEIRYENDQKNDINSKRILLAEKKKKDIENRLKELNLDVTNNISRLNDELIDLQRNVDNRILIYQNELRTLNTYISNKSIPESSKILSKKRVETINSEIRSLQLNFENRKTDINSEINSINSGLELIRLRNELSSINKDIDSNKLRRSIKNIRKDGIFNSDKVKHVLKYNNYNNKYAETSYKASLSNSQIVMRLSWEDINLEAFTPDKSYLVSFDNREYSELYNGYYHLDTIIYTFDVGNNEGLSRIVGETIFTKIIEEV